MSGSLTVKVTAENIEKGECASPSRCMIAHAISTQFPHLTYPFVTTQYIRVTDKVTARRLFFETPRKAQKAILAFDEKKAQAIRPFTFTAPLVKEQPMGWAANHPNASKKVIAKRARGRKAYKKTGRKTVVFTRVAGATADSASA